MSDITSELLDALVEFAHKKGIPDRVDSLKEDILDHAFDELNFEGDEEELWQQLRSRLGAAPAALTQDPHRMRRAGGGTAPKAPPVWNSADLENCTAPYRFTALNGRVSRLPDGGQHDLNDYTGGRVDAVIDVNWSVETPILIGKVKKKNDKNGKDQVVPLEIGGDYSIPGASLRGLLRSSLEAIAFGRLFQVNRHRRFALRDFNHDAYGAFITSAQGKPGLQAGWLRMGADGPEITPCHWGFVRISDLSTDEDWKNKDRAWKYKKAGITWLGAEAFTQPQTYRKTGPHQNRDLYQPDPAGQEGFAVFAGRAPGAKMYEYVFFDQPGVSPVPVSATAWRDFEDLNTKPSKNGRDPAGAWAEFHDRNKPVMGRVPVFYMGDLTRNGEDPDFYFGLTRLFRIPHRYKLGDVLQRAGEEHRPAEAVDGKLVLKPDFIENLFGYVYEPDELEFGHAGLKGDNAYTPPDEVARKGRVAFGFAAPAKDSDFTLWPNEPVKTILGTPNPSFAPFYLAGNEKDYSAPGARLAGRKRYIVRKTPQGRRATESVKQLLSDQSNSKVSDAVHSSLQFLKPGNKGVFHSRIRMNNVSQAELGAVLWALTFGGNAECRHLIGHAKAFGAGQVLVSGLDVHIRGFGEEAKISQIKWQSTDGRNGIDTLLEQFEEAVAGLAKFETVEAWRRAPEVTEFLKIATLGGVDEEHASYLPFGTNAKRFSDLRAKTGKGARNVPDRLLGG